ncbi:hypothetical protein F5Y03DRAFT_365892 [Xylaria venustula]|nr:hypothetical protein F5Y03DRAFT_365892 [Xylaria venustula]
MDTGLCPQGSSGCDEETPPNPGIRHQVLQKSLTWPSMSHRHQDDVISYSQDPRQIHSNRHPPPPATFIAVAFVARCRLRATSRAAVQQSHPLANPLFLLFAVFFSLGAVQLQRSIYRDPDTTNQSERVQVINVYIRDDVGLVGVLLLVILLRQYYPRTTVINTVRLSGVGHIVHQRG